MGSNVFKEGDTVYHWEYGKGIINGVQKGKILGCTYGVCFEDIGNIWAREEHLSFTPYDLVNGGLSHERPFELEVGKSYRAKGGVNMVINRIGYFNNYGFYDGRWVDSLSCYAPDAWREVSDVEVREALEKETIRRFGENWEDVKIKRAIYDVDEDCINMGIYYSGEIDQNPDGWYVCGKNGHLFYKGVWAEKLEEPEFKPFDKVLVRDQEEDNWEINLFDRFNKNPDYKYRCLGSLWKHLHPLRRQQRSFRHLKLSKTMNNSEQFLNNIYEHIYMYEIANAPFWMWIIPSAWQLKIIQRRTRRKFQTYKQMIHDAQKKQRSDRV